MPDRVELVGEEELMPGRKWLVYRNQSTGQLSKVPKEIMQNPSTGPLMMNHLSGYTDVAAQHANPSAEFQVQGALNDTRKMAPDKSMPWVPPGRDYARMGGQEVPVPQSPYEAIRLLRGRLAGQPTLSSDIPYSSDPQTRLYEMGEEESELRSIPGSEAALDAIRRNKMSIHRGNK